MKIAVQLDPLDSLDKDKDSSLYLIREALKQGDTVWYYLPQDLYLDCGTVKALCRTLYLLNDALEEDQEKDALDLNDMDVVMIRNNPPIDIAYISCTNILDMLNPSTLVVNDPKALRDIPEKLFICRYPEFMPPTVVTQNLEIAKNFFEKQKDIVLKPLYEYGGKDVLRIQEMNSFHESFNKLVNQYSTPIMLQKFLPAVANGDKRVFLIDGVIAAYFYRIPKDGEIRANTIHGSEIAKCTLTASEEKACIAIGKTIAEKGIIFAGLDLIDGYVTEVNVTSVGAIHFCNELYKFEGPNTIEAKVWKCIKSKIHSR